MSGRWMLFVDGENFTMRAQELAQREGFTLTPSRFYERDVFAWVPEWGGLTLLQRRAVYLPFGSDLAIRAYYYTSVIGDEDRVMRIREALRNLEFEPKVFKKDSGTRRSKGVDITLTKDMLSHTFLDNIDVAVLVAGDGDYVPLVEEVKRMGKQVYILFFEGDGLGLSRELRLAADGFRDISARFLKDWREQGPASPV